MTAADKMPDLPEPDAWLCLIYNEDGSVKTMFVEEDPEGLRFNDAGEPSPFMAQPLLTPAKVHAYARQHAAAVAGPLVEALAELLAVCFQLAEQQAMPDRWWQAKTDAARAAIASFKENQK